MATDKLEKNVGSGIFRGIGVLALCATTLIGCGKHDEQQYSLNHSTTQKSSSGFGIVTYMQLMNEVPEAKPVEPHSQILYGYDETTGRGIAISDFSALGGKKTTAIDTSRTSDELTCVGLEGKVNGGTTLAQTSFFPKYLDENTLFSSTVGNETYFYLWFRKDTQAFLDGSDAPIIFQGLLRNGQYQGHGPLSVSAYAQLRSAVKQIAFQYSEMQNMYARLRAGERPGKTNAPR